MAWYLDEKETSTRTPIKDGDVIGREGNLSFPHMTKMSRNHLKISIENDLCYITDLASKNGTILDGKLCSPNTQTMVNDGSMLSVGEKIFRIRRSDKTQTLQIQPLTLDEAKRAQPLLRPDQKLKGKAIEDEDDEVGEKSAKRKKLKAFILIGLGIIVALAAIKFLA
jgi:pSer/pThr/pTyr-binding forkhead associated (FHA) protein